MKKDISTAFSSSQWWEECYQAFFGQHPGPGCLGYLALIVDGSSTGTFAVIASSSNHVEASERALAWYAEAGKTLPIGASWLIYGPCRDENCRCGGVRRGIEFLRSKKSDVQ